MPDSSKSNTEASGRCLGASPDTCRAIADKPFIVRGKITFALSLKEESADTAEFQVRNGLDELTETLQDDLGLDFTVHEWEVLTEQIERS